MMYLFNFFHIPPSISLNSQVVKNKKQEKAKKTLIYLFV